MPEFQLLSKAQHADLKIRPRTSFIDVVDPILPLTMAELVHAFEFPLAFADVAGTTTLVALCGFQPGQNLYVAPDGKWLGNYVPAIIRQLPFAVLHDNEKDEQRVCIDVANPQINRLEGAALFEADGNPAPTLAATIEFLRALEQNRAQTSNAVALLKNYGLLAPWPIKLRDPSGKETNLDGLQQFIAEKLEALDEGAFGELRRTGALLAAYAQFLAQRRLQGLSALQNLQAQLRKAANPSGFVIAGDQSSPFGAELHF